MVRWNLVRSSLGVLMAAALLRSLLFPEFVLAAETASCSDIQQNRWRGHGVTGGQKHGASATASATSLEICTNPIGISVDASLFFSNVTPTTGAHFNDIVQYGYGRCRSPACPEGMWTYFGWGRDQATPGCAGFSNVNPLIFAHEAWTSAPHTFAINHVNDAFRGYKDGVFRIGVVESAICWTPARAVWFGETLDFGDQLGGTSTAKLHVTNAQYQNSEGAGFIVTSFVASDPCNYQTGTAPYFCDIVGTRSLDLWTDR